jgi:hypothetical protein
VRTNAGIIESEIVEDLMPEKAPGKSGHRHCLNGSPFERTAGPIIEEGFEREAEGNLVVAGTLDVTRKRNELGSDVFT